MFFCKITNIVTKLCYFSSLTDKDLIGWMLHFLV